MVLQAIEFKRAAGCEKVQVLDVGAGSGLLSMMAARQAIRHRAAIVIQALPACGTQLHPRRTLLSIASALLYTDTVKVTACMPFCSDGSSMNPVP